MVLNWQNDFGFEMSAVASDAKRLLDFDNWTITENYTLFTPYVISQHIE